jgi:hypothetical protein
MRFTPQKPFDNGSDVYIRGRRDQDGFNWINIRVGSNRSQFHRQTDYRGSGTNALKALDAAGFNLSKAQFAELQEQVQSLNEFTDATRFVQPGWSGNEFALSGGTIIRRTKRQCSIIGFETQTNRTRKTGKHKAWIEGVGLPLAGCALPEFCLMAMCVAPILNFVPTPFNFGFELAGGPATGKTTLATVCASMAGPVGGQYGSYVETMNATPNWLDAAMPMFNDMPLILEEMNLLNLGQGAAAGRKFAELVFKLAEGQPKRRFNHTPGSDARFVWLATTNQSWPALARDFDPATAMAVADRVITLPVPPVEAGGIYKRSVDQQHDVSALSRQLVSAAASAHGTALRKLIRYLQRQMDKDGEAKIKSRLDAHIEKFCRKIRKHTDPVDERLLRSFGIVYAAGRLAVDCGALPEAFKPFRSCEYALKLHLDARSTIKSPLQALADLAKGPEVLDLRKKPKAGTPEAVDSASCVLRKSGRRVELILTPEQMAKFEIKFPSALNDAEVAALLRRETSKRLVYRNIVPTKRQQVYVFNYEALLANLGLE